MILDLDVFGVICLWSFAGYQDNTRLDEIDEVRIANLTFIRFSAGLTLTVCGHPHHTVFNEV